MKRARIWLTSPLLTLALACSAGGGGGDAPIQDPEVDPVGNGGTGGTSGAGRLSPIASSFASIFIAGSGSPGAVARRVRAGR